MTKMRAPTAADGKAVYEAMIAAGEKPTQRAIAERLSSEFHPSVSHKVIGRWMKHGWTDGQVKNKPPEPEQQATQKLSKAVGDAKGDSTLTMAKWKETPEAKELIADLEGKPLHELVRLAAEEQFRLLILTARFTQRLIIEGKQATNQEGEVVTEPASPAQVGGLVSALSGSFSTATSVGDKARDLSLKNVTPPALEGGKVIEGEIVQEPADELASILSKARQVARAPIDDGE